MHFSFNLHSFARGGVCAPGKRCRGHSPEVTAAQTRVQEGRWAPCELAEASICHRRPSRFSRPTPLLSRHGANGGATQTQGNGGRGKGRRNPLAGCCWSACVAFLHTSCFSECRFGYGFDRVQETAVTATQVTWLYLMFQDPTITTHARSIPAPTPLLNYQQPAPHPCRRKPSRKPTASS